MFTEKERAYLGSQRLARLATVSPAGQPDADIVGFKFDGEDILIGSYENLAGSRKYKNVAAGSDRVSLIVDSLASVDPMDPVAVNIHGTAAIEHRNGPGLDQWSTSSFDRGRRGAGASRDRPSSMGISSRTRRSRSNHLAVARTLNGLDRPVRSVTAVHVRSDDARVLIALELEVTQPSRCLIPGGAVAASCGLKKRGRTEQRRSFLRAKESI